MAFPGFRLLLLALGRQVFPADHIFDRADPDIVDQISELLPIQFWVYTISLPGSVQKIINPASMLQNEDEKEIHVVILLPASMPRSAHHTCRYQGPNDAIPWQGRRAQDPC
jgi:hypothetical protein